MKYIIDKIYLKLGYADREPINKNKREMGVMEEKQVLLKMGSKAERCMVFGIVSIMLSFLFAPVSIVFSIIGLRMYKKAIAEGASGGILMAGYVLSLIGLTMSTVMLVVSIVSIIFV
ncbi:MAG: hypothetical protein KH420_04920, partial [Clostridiales bacterium]|nr:hypothetical protein [Clostridiales bacterium]